MGADRSTLLDIAKATDPNGAAAMVIEVLNQKNPILQDAPALPSNAPMGNRVTLRSSLPTVAFTKVNKGVIRSKSSTRQQVDTIGLLSGLSEVDSKMKKIVGASAFQNHRFSEDRAFMESMAQQIASTLLYGNELTAEASFTGLAPRLNTLATAITGSQVVSQGTVTGGDGTSIFIVDWGQDTCHLVFPKDGEGVAGVDASDKGEMRVDDVDGNPMMAHVTSYDWLVGLTVKDPRHIARLANIDVSDANVLSPTQGLLVDKLIDIASAMPDAAGSQRVMYCNQRILAGFYKQALNKSNMALRIEEYLGRPTPHFWDIPIRAVDQVSLTETTVA